VLREIRYRVREKRNTILVFLCAGDIVFLGEAM